MRVLFVDVVCNKPYDPEVLLNEPLGGTESTVIRVAEELAYRPEIEQVYVMQHNRLCGSGDNPRYIGPSERIKGQPTHVVLLRSPLLLQSLREQFPCSQLYLWAHDEFLWMGWRVYFQVLLDTDTLPICVSQWHQVQMLSFADHLGFKGIPSCYIYNPIDDDLLPDATPTDAEKLIFFSSPHKGLSNTLCIFQALRQIDGLKKMKLYISNPGYHEDRSTKGLANVINLGRLSHGQAIAHVRSSFAVLHLNNECPETFGLVHVEANAVGVPFLNAPLGATPEICPDQRQIVDVTNIDVIAERLMSWRRGGRPVVQVNPAFRNRKVIDAWIDRLLGRESRNEVESPST